MNVNNEFEIMWKEAVMIHVLIMWKAVWTGI